METFCLEKLLYGIKGPVPYLECFCVEVLSDNTVCDCMTIVII